jgi:hypothetical protein
MSLMATALEFAGPWWPVQALPVDSVSTKTTTIKG